MTIDKVQFIEETERAKANVEVMRAFNLRMFFGNLVLGRYHLAESYLTYAFRMHYIRDELTLLGQLAHEVVYEDELLPLIKEKEKFMEAYRLPGCAKALAPNAERAWRLARAERTMRQMKGMYNHFSSVGKSGIRPTAEDLLAFEDLEPAQQVLFCESSISEWHPQNAPEIFETLQRALATLKKENIRPWRLGRYRVAVSKEWAETLERYMCSSYVARKDNRDIDNPEYQEEGFRVVALIQDELVVVTEVKERSPDGYDGGETPDPMSAYRAKEVMKQVTMYRAGQSQILPDIRPQFEVAHYVPTFWRGKK